MRKLNEFYELEHFKNLDFAGREEYKVLSSKRNEAEKNLIDTFSDEQLILFEKFRELDFALSDYVENELYKYSFSSGVSLVIESLILQS